MSIFNSEDQNGNQGDEGNNQESWVERIAADKGEQFRDPENLAKSLFHANLHLKTLEEENSKYKESQTKEEFGKELLEELRKSQQPASGELAKSDNNTGGTNENTTQFKPEDIKKLVEEAVTEREQLRSREGNLNEADKVMRERFGDQAGVELEKRAKELGVDKEYLAEVAGKSPTAFMRMIGEPPAQQTNTTTSSSTNTAALHSGSSGKRNWAYYQNLRKTNPRGYQSAETQKQMEKDYAEMGASFWK